MIDWDVAISTGVRWARPGPQVSLSEARAVVAELRELAAAVAEPVREVTGMFSAQDGGWVAVVDRPGWIRANVDGFRVVLDPLAAHLREKGGAPPAGSMMGAVGSRVTGMQAGLILAYLAGRVLGQYELFLPPDPNAPDGVAPAGRLTFSADFLVQDSGAPDEVAPQAAQHALEVLPVEHSSSNSIRVWIFTLAAVFSERRRSRNMRSRSASPFSTSATLR